MLWDMHLCVFDVRLSFENRVLKVLNNSYCGWLVLEKVLEKIVTFDLIKM